MDAIIAGDEERSTGDKQVDQLHAGPDAGWIVIDKAVISDADGLLIGEGASTNFYANVMRGVVKMSKVTEDGNQQLVGLQFAPDFIGRLFGDVSTVTLEAASDLHLCVIPRGALEQILTKNTTLERRLMQQNLRELDDARDWMVTLGRKSARQKVASFLHLFASHASSPRNRQTNAISICRLRALTSELSWALRSRW